MELVRSGTGLAELWLGGLFVRQTEGPPLPPPQVQLHTSLHTSARTYRKSHWFGAMVVTKP